VPAARKPPLSRARATRLSGVGAFQTLLRNGARRDGRYMQLIFVPAASLPGRAGFIVGAKAMPRAVDRNRLKRKLRELLRAFRPRVNALDVVFRVRQALPRQAIDAAADEARVLLVAVLASP